MDEPNGTPGPREDVNRRVARERHETHLARAALSRFGLGLSRHPLRWARVVSAHKTRNYKSIFAVASLRHGRLSLHLYRGEEPAEEALRCPKVLRSYEGRASGAALRSQAAWMTALRGAGLPLPEPVPTVEGDLVARVPEPSGTGHRRGLLLRWVPGAARPDRLSPLDMRLVGRYLARMHRLSERFSPHESFVRPEWGYDHVFGPSSPLWEKGEAFFPAQEMEVFRLAAARVEASLTAVGKGREAFGLIHADPHHENFVFRDRRLARRTVAAVDFDRSGWGHYLYDVATTMRAVRSYGNATRPLQEALLEGYLEERPLPRGWREHLEACLALRLAELVGRVLDWRDVARRPHGPKVVSGAPGRLAAYLEGNPGPLFC